MPNHRMIRVVGLNQNLPRALTAAGTTGQLKEQLHGLLGGPQIRSMQQTVGCKHRRQGDTRQIHALGKHLGADQHIRLPAGETIQKAAMAVATTR